MTDTPSTQADRNMAPIIFYYTLILTLSLEMAAFQESPGSTCNRRGVALRNTSGKISSPGWPGVYPKNLLCIWRLYPQEGQALYFTFKFFQLGYSTKACHHDNLTLIDAAHHVARTFCGSDNKELFKQPLYIPSSGVDILFRTDNQNNGEHGFVMEYQAVACKAVEIPKGAGVQVEGSSVIITCPDGTTRSLQCINNQWMPLVTRPLCPGMKRLPWFELSIIAIVAFILILIVIACACWLTRRWTRKKEHPPPVYQAVHLADIDTTQNIYNSEKDLYAKPCACTCEMPEKPAATPGAENGKKVVYVDEVYANATPLSKKKILIEDPTYSRVTPKNQRKVLLVEDPYGRMTPKDNRKLLLVEDTYAQVTPREKKKVVIVEKACEKMGQKEKKRTTFSDGYDVYGRLCSPANERRKIAEDNVYAQVTPKSLRHKRPENMYAIPVKIPTVEDIQAKNTKCNTLPTGKTDEEKSREKLSEDIDIHIQLVPKEDRRSWPEFTT